MQFSLDLNQVPWKELIPGLWKNKYKMKLNIFILESKVVLKVGRWVDMSQRLIKGEPLTKSGKN